MNNAVEPGHPGEYVNPEDKYIIICPNCGPIRSYKRKCMTVKSVLEYQNGITYFPICSCSYCDCWRLKVKTKE